MQNVTEETRVRKWYMEFIAGNQKSFENIVLLYKDRLILFIKTYVGRWEIAEELSQDVFVYLLLHKEKYDMAYSFKSYLYLIARCRALNYLKKEKRIVLYDEMPEEIVSTMEEEFVEKEKLNYYLKAIQKLKKEYMNVLYLVDIEGLSYRETSHILGKTESSIKLLIHRARKKLKSEIGKEEN